MPPMKTIVISDIHISDGATYSWFTPSRSDRLAAMLNMVANDPEVGELVLLGDIFDLWLYPVDVVPLTVSQILDRNPKVAAAFKVCVGAKSAVYYLNGNHDMAATQADLADPRLTSDGKQIRVITTDWYKQNCNSKWHFEHGHEGDMFNARDDSLETIGEYPLGYFITRLAATAGEPKAACDKVRRVLTDFKRDLNPLHMLSDLEQLSKGSFLVSTIINALVEYANEKTGKDLRDSAPLRLANPALDNVTIGDVKQHYRGLFQRWVKKYGRVAALDSMLATFEDDGLDWWAHNLLSASPDLQVVAMGHTHSIRPAGGAGPAANPDPNYYNDGCWCTDGPSYMRITGDQAETVLFTDSLAKSATV